MIPANLDYMSLIGDLNDWGIRDSKIEAICGLNQGLIAKFKCRAQRSMIYENAARLYNFWHDEALAHGVHVPHGTSSSQPLPTTTY